jgi:hypothetical protein
MARTSDSLSIIQGNHRLEAARLIGRKYALVRFS